LAERTFDSKLQDEARDRAVRLFRFVQAFNERRNPPIRNLERHEWVLSLEDVPEHDTIDITRVVHEGNGADEFAEDAESVSRVILRCERSDPTSPPAIPPELEQWLGNDWRDARKNPSPIPSIITTIDGEAIEEAFADSGERLASFREYCKLWYDWAGTESVALAARQVFDRLFELYSRLQREGDNLELVLGNGLLSWTRGMEKVYHPVLTTPLQLSFDPEVPEFVASEVGSGTEFYHALLNNVEGVDGTMLGALRDEVEELGLHPLGDYDTPAFLKSMATRLSKDGRFIPDDGPGFPSESPIIGRQPIIFLRKRTTGLSKAISALVAAIKNGSEITQPIMNIVGIDAPARYGTDDEGPIYRGLVDANADEEILFTLEANAEQLAIARKLGRQDGVLVQGPPGTGKTHTIANVIGHLLANGKTVLVTSQTAKALKVLKDKVAPELQPMCMSVIDTAEDDAALKHSISGIVERISTADDATLEREITLFTAKRLDLIKQLGVLRHLLKTARLSESLEIVLSGEPIHPIEAAKVVAAGFGLHDWIPGEVIPGSMLSLDIAELARLYELNGEVTREEEDSVTGTLPDITVLPRPEEFSALLASERELSGRDLSVLGHLWSDTAPGFDDVDALEELRQEIHACLDPLSAASAWAIKLIEVGLVGVEGSVWESLIAEIEELHREEALAKQLLLTNEPVTASRLEERRVRVYGEILQEVSRSGKPPGKLALLMRGDWRIAVEESRVHGDSRPRTKEHFEALLAKAKLEHRRTLLMRRWANQVVAIGGPKIEEEQFVSQALLHVSSIRSSLGWADSKWARVLSSIGSCGLVWDRVMEEATYRHAGLTNIQRIEAIVQNDLDRVLTTEADRRRSIYCKARLSEIRESLAALGGPFLARRLTNAVLRDDEASYEQSYREVERIMALEGKVRDRLELLRQLSIVAPEWADAVRRREGVHGTNKVPGDAQSAWRWAQYSHEINRRSQLSLTDIGKQIEAVRAQLKRATIDLVDRKAWLQQIRRTSLKERNALFGFLSAKRAYGKGTGKRAARLMAEQRRLMSEARTAVPVWITSIAKAVEIFNPETIPFDVVIIDEASQSDVTALVALCLGRQVLVVGDNEQVSPADVGHTIEATEQLVDSFLADIPNAKLYDGKLSLYAIAEWSFGGPTMLLEHFRSVPDIIRFSNVLSYGGQIRPLREVTESSLLPSVIEHRVNGIRDGYVNDLEAKTIVSLIKACTELEEYEGCTMGVISLLGDDQARRIEELLYQVVAPDEVAERRIIAGNASQFQGDERDVMFLSLVDASEGFLPLMEMRLMQQRYNVAASRARDQMWVVHSLDPAANLKEGDLRRKLIEHAQNPEALKLEAEAAIERAESPFEEEVITRLSDAGYHIASNYVVGKFRVDIVLSGADTKKKLAIECDGARYHGPEQLDYDMQRQADLERAGWRFVRIRGTSWYRDREKAIAPVFERLKAIGISPLFGGSAPAQPPASPLLDRVRIRAQQILLEIQQAEATGEVRLAQPRRRVKARRNGKASADDGLFAATTANDRTDSPDDEAVKSEDNQLGARPQMAQLDSIDAYSSRSLRNMTEWVLSRNGFDSAEELARGVSSELGFQRFGSKIAAILLPIAKRVLRNRSE
jgi:very-short-patch-repair endonuclease